MKSKITAIALVLASFTQGCGGTTTGNPVVTLKVAPYTALAQKSWLDLLIPSAYAATFGATFCFERLRFKTENSGNTGDSSGSSNFDFFIGEVTLSPSGNTLGEVTLPAGTYRRVEFDFKVNCSGTNATSSVDVTTTNYGRFTTTDTITVKFEGTFVAAGVSDTLELNFQNLINALEYNFAPVGADTIKERLEAVSGSF